MDERPTNVRKTLLSLSTIYPFTIAGTLLFALVVLILGRGLFARDPYELVLAVIALIVLILLALIGRMQAAQFSKLHVQWDTSVALVASTPGARTEAAELQRLTGIIMKPFLWFRVHFTIRGRLQVGRGAWLRVTHEVATAGEEIVPLRFSVPLSGVLDARGVLSIGDIFGLTRSRFGTPIERRITVQPAVFPEEIGIRVEASEKTEEKQSQLNSDEDKYYMREYAPGDRFRDINWKTSTRLHQLFTRIAPVALEQTKIIAVEFRNYREARPETLESIVHLSHLKSWLISFLRTIKERNPDFVFNVVTGHGVRKVESKEDIARFAEELAGMMYLGDSGVLNTVPETDEIFLFTTPYDKLLPVLLPRYPQRTINVVRTLTGGWTGGATRRQIPLFSLTDELPLPGLWALRRDGAISQPGIELGSVRIIAQEVVEARFA